MQPRGNRTFICSVAFLDIIEYSKKGVTSQIALKEQLNKVLGDALKGVSPNDRIILDTGDGAAISFVGDPEQALFVSLMLRNAAEQRKPGATDELNVRIGINLGPVKLIKDLNGQANIVGDGINVAQRIMSFAEPNQILVSRSYYEVVSCLSEAYGKMFHYEGSRTDKHVREHEVYAVGDSAGELRQSIEAAQTTSTELSFGLRLTRSIVERLANTTVRTAVRVRDRLHARPRLSTALAVVAILALAITVRATRDRPPVQVAQAPAPPPAVKNVAPPKAEKAAPAPKEAAPAPKVEVKAPEEKAAPPAPGQKAREKAPKRTETAQAPASPALPGVVALAIAPWGEVIVDGKSLGVSPPVQELRLAPGRHRIEVRNTSFTPHVQVVEVKSGERIRIRHRFQ